MSYGRTTFLHIIRRLGHFILKYHTFTLRYANNYALKAIMIEINALIHLVVSYYLPEQCLDL